MSTTRRFRLITRGDFDGLACAVLLRELDLVEDILLVQPKDMQDGKIEVGPEDITANLPYVPGAHLCFDHHDSESLRLRGIRLDSYIFDPLAPSTARLIFDYYGGDAAFPGIPRDMMEAVDKSDSARFTRSEILHPSRWVLLAFIMDSRTGLGRFRQFAISNYQLMLSLVDWCPRHPIDDILALPDVNERVELYFDHEERAEAQIRRCAEIHDNLVIVDYRDEDPIFACNRFLVYALYPQCNVSMHVLWGRERQNTVFALGKSIINRTHPSNIGRLTLRYGGGGHRNAGTCQVPNPDCERVFGELATRLRCAPAPGDTLAPGRAVVRLGDPEPRGAARPVR